MATRVSSGDIVTLPRTINLRPRKRLYYKSPFFASLKGGFSTNYWVYLMHIFDLGSSVQCDFNNACTAVASIEYAQCASHRTKSTFNHNARQLRKSDARGGHGVAASLWAPCLTEIVPNYYLLSVALDRNLPERSVCCLSQCSQMTQNTKLFHTDSEREKTGITEGYRDESIQNNLI